MDSYSSYSELWVELEKEAETTHRHGMLRRRILPEAKPDFFVALMLPTRHRFLIISVPIPFENFCEPIPECRNLSINFGTSLGDQRGHTSLVIKLEEHRYADIFSTLVFDIISHIQCLAADESAILQALERLRRWQVLLRELPPEGLSQEAQRGLFGELLFIKERLLLRLEARRAISSWKGPDHDAQDFVIGRTAVEVKTSLISHSKTVRIASARQLDESDFENLFLFHIILKTGESGGTTLPQLVERISDQLASDAFTLRLFNDRLLTAGYMSIHQSHYDGTFYTVHTSNAYRVNKGFPHIKEADLVPGIVDTTYSIIVGYCFDCQVKTQELEEVIIGGARE